LLAKARGGGESTEGAGGDGSTFTKDQVADVQMSMAMALERQGKAEPAIEAYTRVAREFEVAEAYHRLAVLEDKAGRFDESEEHFIRAIELQPGNAETFCDLGYSYYLQRRWDRAEKSLRHAISLSPDCARAHNNLGLMLARVGRSDEALKSFAAAGCDEAQARVNLAFAMITENRPLDAREQLVHALAVDSSLDSARDLLGSLDRSQISLARHSTETLR
jgi:Flp pilus assembly protein TadD